VTQPTLQTAPTSKLSTETSKNINKLSLRATTTSKMTTFWKRIIT